MLRRYLAAVWSTCPAYVDGRKRENTCFRMILFLLYYIDACFYVTSRLSTTSSSYQSSYYYYSTTIATATTATTTITTTINMTTTAKQKTKAIATTVDTDIAASYIVMLHTLLLSAAIAYCMSQFFYRQLHAML